MFNKAIYNTIGFFRHKKSLKIFNAIMNTENSNIIIEKLYLGNIIDAHNLSFLIDNNIGAIINCTEDEPFHQYFIMNEKTQIAFVSAANKLKGHQDIETDLTTYASRKKEGINVTLKLINERYPQWEQHFTKHKKKDDLADAFLQGNWYLKNIK